MTQARTRLRLPRWSELCQAFVEQIQSGLKALYSLSQSRGLSLDGLGLFYSGALCVPDCAPEVGLTHDYACDVSSKKYTER